MTVREALDRHFRRMLAEHLPEDITVCTYLDGEDLIVTDAEGVQFLDGRNVAVDSLRKMYRDILAGSVVENRPVALENLSWLDEYMGSFKEAFDRVTVEFKRMSDSTSADWPVSRLPNERGVEAPDPDYEFMNR